MGKYVQQANAASWANNPSCLRAVGRRGRQRGLPLSVVSLSWGGRSQVNQLDTHSLPEKGLHISSRIRRYVCGGVTQGSSWAKALTDAVSGRGCRTVTSNSSIGTDLSNQASAQGPYTTRCPGRGDENTKIEQPREVTASHRPADDARAQRSRSSEGEGKPTQPGHEGD